MNENKKLFIQYGGDSDIGVVRTENQDSFGKFPSDSEDLTQNKGLLFIVADGMGGHAGGKEASQLAVEIVSREYFSFSSEVVSNALLYAFKTANLKIHQSSADVPQFQKKGTTCSALVLENSNAHIAHVGDSRIYRIEHGKIIQLTQDHTEVSEMFRKGILSEEEVKVHPAKSVLVRALGIEPDIEVDIIENIKLNDGDIFVLCSDGLAKVSVEEIKDVVLNNQADTACKKLLSLANESGGKDNITVQVIKVSSEQGSEYFPNTTDMKKSKQKWWLFSILILILILIISLTVIFFHKEIRHLIYLESDRKSDLQVKNSNDILNDGNTDVLLSTADGYLATGDLDSALFIYCLILNENPMHAGALNGKDFVGIKYLQKANQLIGNNEINDALIYYDKAFELNPNDKELEDIIVSLRKKKKLLTESVNNSLIKTENYKKEDKPQQEVHHINNPGVLIPNDDFSQWDADGLTENDYNQTGNDFSFFNTKKQKKLIYIDEMEDIDIEVNLRIDQSNDIQKVGLIAGYEKSDKHNSERFYLFTASNTGNFSLIKIQDNHEEILISTKRKSDLYKNEITLKLKCLGPWIMLYNDNKLLDSYLSNEFIRGRIGLYCDSNTIVEFKDLKISSAFENNNE